jgi:hypothetical protein
MQKQLLIAAMVAGMFSVAGCQTTTTPATPAKAQLNDEAKMALAWAEADVKEAGKSGALWTTAADALKSAQEAAAKGDNSATLKAAKNASAQAKLGLAQKKDPLMTLSN